GSLHSARPMRSGAGPSLFAWLLIVLGACAGPDTKLIKLRPVGHEARLSLTIRNLSNATIDGFYLAPSARVKLARGHSELGSAAEAETWGNDRLPSALGVGEEQSIPGVEAGLWDARPIDEDGRYQHIAGLRFEPGARYVLE